MLRTYLPTLTGSTSLYLFLLGQWLNYVVSGYLLFVDVIVVLYM